MITFIQKGKLDKINKTEFKSDCETMNNKQLNEKYKI